MDHDVAAGRRGDVDAGRRRQRRAVRQREQRARDRGALITVGSVGGHAADVAADERMLVLRRVQQHAAILRADAGAEAVADAERHLAHRARLS